MFIYSTYFIMILLPKAFLKPFFTHLSLFYFCPRSISYWLSFILAFEGTANIFSGEIEAWHILNSNSKSLPIFCNWLGEITDHSDMAKLHFLQICCMQKNLRWIWLGFLQMILYPQSICFLSSDCRLITCLFERTSMN